MNRRIFSERQGLYGRLDGSKVRWANLIDRCKFFPTSAMLKFRMSLPPARPKSSSPRVLFNGQSLDYDVEKNIMKWFNPNSYK